MRFGILERYVMGEIFRSFFMALLTITIVFVLFMVMAQATGLGLTPSEIGALIPFIIPGSLIYTMPVSLLFAVTVVYGRLAGDNEVIAVKAAGQSTWTVLWPAMTLGFVLSAGLGAASWSLIPAANVQAKKVIFKSFEDVFYKYLKKDREMTRPDWPFQIKVRDVEGRELIGATFKHRAGKPDPTAPKGVDESDDPAFFDATIQAGRARIDFDLDANIAHVYLDDADVSQKGNVYLINDTQIDIPLPSNMNKPMEKRIQEKTIDELDEERRSNLEKMANERKRQSYAAALWIGSGRIERVNWPEFQAAFVDYAFWEQRNHENATEKQMRIAMACGCFFFVFLGGPVGIRFARRDFLSAFITCFVPIIIIYYPLMLGGQNMGKEGIIDPRASLWVGNLVLLAITGPVLRPVLRH